MASNHRVSPLCAAPTMSMLRACPNMTLALEWDIQP